MAKKLRRNDTSYQQLKVEKAKHKQALANPEIYRRKRHMILEVIADMKFIPKFGAFKLSIQDI